MSDEQRMTAEEADDFTQALGSVLTGGYRLVFQGWRLGVPRALDMTVQDWVQDRLGGYIKMAEKDRQKAIEAMQEERVEAGEKRMSTRELGAILGVDQSTVVRDGGDANTSPASENRQQDGQSDDDADANASPETEPDLPARQTDDERLGQLPNDLAIRVQEDGLSLDEAEEIAVGREERLQVWETDIRRAITVLTRLAGYPVPAGLMNKFDHDEQTTLTRVLAALPTEGES